MIFIVIVINFFLPQQENKRLIMIITSNPEYLFTQPQPSNFKQVTKLYQIILPQMQTFILFVINPEYISHILIS